MKFVTVFFYQNTVRVALQLRTVALQEKKAEKKDCYSFLKK